MRVINIKILCLLIILLLGTGTASRGQDTSITIRADTIKTPRTRTITIVTVWTVPKFILHINGGYNGGALELTSHNGGFSREDFNTGKNYGARNGFGFNITGKIPLGKKGSFWLDIVTGFDRFQSNIFAKNTDEGKVYYNSFNGGVGIEYNFSATHKVKYFFGLNPLISIISGKAELLNPDNNRVDVRFKSSFRMGYQAFFGIEYAIDKKFGLNIGMRFTHANLLFKNTEEPVEDPNQTTPLSTVPLNDDSTTEPVQFAGWKQFAYFSGNIGISYFFGVKEKKYRLP
jgi:hypothetical protein